MGISRSDFREVYENFGPMVIRFFRSKGYDDDVAQDLTQETFLWLFKSRDRFDPNLGSLRGWIQSIALNVWRNYERYKKTRSRSADETISFDHEEIDQLAASRVNDPEKNARAKELKGLIDDTIASMGTKMRVCLLLTWQGVPAKEVAQLLDSTPRAVRSNSSQARRRIREALERKLQAGDSLREEK